MSYKHQKRYREKNPHIRKAEREKYYASGVRGEKRPWTTEEDRLVLDRPMTDRELSFKLNRSIRAIQARRYVIRED